MAYKPAERNYDGIQFEKLRRKIDPPINELHDKLSACYIDGEPFEEYGVLDKETFDELHGLIFHHHLVKLHDENMKLPKKQRYSEDEYRWTVNVDGTKEDNVQKARDGIAASKLRGLVHKGLET